jgi:hypothetical protein
MISSQHYEQALLPQSGGRVQSRIANPACVGLFLPGTLLVTVGAQLFAPFMFIDLSFSTFLE